MATETVPNRAREGAQAFIDMMKSIHKLTEADLERYADVTETGRDVRNYRAVSELIGAALRLNLFEADVEHAQGFLRAFADLLCINVDGSGRDTAEDWDPIRTTAAAYGETVELCHG